MSNNIRFGYFQVHAFWQDGDLYVVPKRLGYITAAMIRPPKGSNNIHQIGFSFCSPLDSFNKKFGRSVAIGRLQKKPIVFKFEGSSMVDAYRAGLDAALKQDRLPKWIERTINTGNIEFGLGGETASNISFVDLQNKMRKVV